MPEHYLISIVIPCYKEEDRIHKILEAIMKYEGDKDFAVETLIVLDGTPDDTKGAAEKYYDKVRHLRIIDRKENKGKGFTVKQGMLEAKGDWILFADADNSTPVEQVDKLLHHKKDYQVLIGSRRNNGGREARPQPWHRIIGSQILNRIIQFAAVPGIKDTQCGFKLFENKAAKEIFNRMTFDRFSFDIEILAIARHLGYKILEVGILWYDDPHSTVSPIKDGLRMVSDAWQVRRNMRRGLYSR